MTDSDDVKNACFEQGQNSKAGFQHTFFQSNVVKKGNMKHRNLWSTWDSNPGGRSNGAHMAVVIKNYVRRYYLLVQLQAKSIPLLILSEL